MAEYEQITENGRAYVWAIDDSGYDSRFNPIDYDVVFNGTPLEGKYVKKEIKNAEASRRAKHWKIFVDAKLWDKKGGKYKHDQLQVLVMRAMLEFNAQYDRKILSSKASKSKE